MDISTEKLQKKSSKIIKVSALANWLVTIYTVVKERRLLINIDTNHIYVDRIIHIM